MQHYGGDAMTWRLIRITRLALRSNNDRTRWKLLDLLVEQIGAEHYWIKVEQLFEYQTYFARYIICCKCVLHVIVHHNLMYTVISATGRFDVQRKYFIVKSYNYISVDGLHIFSVCQVSHC